MRRIIISLIVLMLSGCAALVIQDVLNGRGFRIADNLVTAIVAMGTAIIMAPLGIMLLYDIYGIHFLGLGLISVSMITFGFLRYKSMLGQVLAVLGLIAWMFLGAYGLGHGG